jgi:hypothetical protein
MSYPVYHSLALWTAMFLWVIVFKVCQAYGVAYENAVLFGMATAAVIAACALGRYFHRNSKSAGVWWLVHLVALNGFLACGAVSAITADSKVAGIQKAAITVGTGVFVTSLVLVIVAGIARVYSRKGVNQ